MATSDTEICNLALAHLGDSNGIGSLTEASAAARACNLFYEQTRDEVLQEMQPTWARRTAALGLVTDFTSDDYYEYAYAYRYPADALGVVGVQNGVSRFARTTTRVPWKIQSDDDGRLLYMDQADAIVEYVVRITDPSRYPPDFTQALALKLSAYLAPSLTGGDPTKLRERNLGLYARQFGITITRNANERQADVQVESGFIDARE